MRIVTNVVRCWLLGAILCLAVFGVAHATSHDLTHEGPDSPVAYVCFLIIVWPAIVIPKFEFIGRDTALYGAVFGALPFVYGELLYYVWRAFRAKANPLAKTAS